MYLLAYGRSLTSVKVSIAANMLLYLEKPTLNAFTNVCPSVILGNKISGKTATDQDFDG